MANLALCGEWSSALSVDASFNSKLSSWLKVKVWTPECISFSTFLLSEFNCYWVRTSFLAPDPRALLQLFSSKIFMCPFFAFLYFWSSKASELARLIVCSLSTFSIGPDSGLID